MRIALCYDLRADYLAAGYDEEHTAEFDSAVTIDAIDATLRELGHRTERVGNVRALARRLVDGAGWDLVFNITEGLSGFGREAQVPALLDAWGLAYTFADPLTSVLTLHKAMAKRVLRDAGVPTTDFCLVERPADIERVELPFPLFAKPVAEGTAKGIDGGSRIDTRAALRERCLYLLERYRQPALIEPFLSGREFTVSLLGSGEAARAIGTLEVRLLPGAEPNSYTYLNKERSEEFCDLPLADAAAAALVEPIALQAWRTLNGRDAGRVDLRLDARGRPFVMEINPLPGLHPTHSDLPILCSAIGMSYAELIRAIVASASSRIAAPREPARANAAPECAAAARSSPNAPR